MIFCRYVFMILLVGVVTGCGPAYKTTYRYSAPQTDIGKVCASGCLEKLQSCRSTCKQDLSECRRIEDLKAKNAYLQYSNERLRAGKEIEKQEYQFRNYYSCNLSCEEDCEGAHRICHVNCGGDVVEQTICTARCDKI